SFFFSSRRRHTRSDRDWSSDVCSSDLVPGEQALPVAPLALPRASMSAAEAVATPSLALFIDRARGARGDFAMTEDNRGALIALRSEERRVGKECRSRWVLYGSMEKLEA